MGLQISAPNGEEWRSAMINAPVFAASTPQAFYQLLLALKSKDPNAVPTFAAGHPEFAGFGAWAKNGPWTGSYAEERFNSLDSFLFEDSKGTSHAVRWSFVPAAQPVTVSLPRNSRHEAQIFSSRRSLERLQSGPVRWTLFRDGGEPWRSNLADPTRPWPRDRRTIEVGTHGRAARSSWPRARWPLPRHQLRSDRPAEGHHDIGRSVPRSPLLGLRQVLRPAQRPRRKTILER